MKLSRSIWILLANGTAVFFIYVESLFDHYDMFSIHFALRAAIPALGILLEFVGSRLARWVNIGFSIFVIVPLYRISYLSGWIDRSIAYPIAATIVTVFMYSRFWLPGATQRALQGRGHK